MNRFLPIILKQLSTVIPGIGSSPNYRSPSSQTFPNFGFRCNSIDLLILVQFSSFHYKSPFQLYYGSSSPCSPLSLRYLSVYSSSELSAPSYKGITSQNSTTIFFCTVAHFRFLPSSCLALSFYGLMHFFPSHLSD